MTTSNLRTLPCKVTLTQRRCYCYTLLVLSLGIKTGGGGGGGGCRLGRRRRWWHGKIIIIMEGVVAAAQKRKVMVVADPTRESAAALEYTLSNAIVENETMILLHVENPNNMNAWRNQIGSFFKWSMPSPSPSSSKAATSPNSEGNGAATLGGGEMDFLDAMKRACEVAQPTISVVAERVAMDGKDKASVILSHCDVLGIDLLIIGQKKTLSNAILGHKRSGSLRGLDTAEYLIENSKCTCVGVQRKGQSAGYLLNTKTQKNFWLLA